MWWRAFLVVVASWISCSAAYAEDGLLGDLKSTFTAENLASSGMTVMSEAKEAVPKAVGSVGGVVMTTYGMAKDLAAGKPAKEVQARAGAQEATAIAAGRTVAVPLIELGCELGGPWGCAGGVAASVVAVAYTSNKAGQAAVAIQKSADQRQAGMEQAGGARSGSSSAVQQDRSRRIGGLSDAGGASGSAAGGSGGVRIGSTSATQPDGSRRIGGTAPEWSDIGSSSGGVRVGSTSALQPDGSRRIGGADDESQYQPPPVAMNTSRDAPCIDYYSLGPSQCKDGTADKKADDLASGGDFAGNWRDADTNCSNPIKISPSGISGPGFSGFANSYCSTTAVRPVQYPNAWRAQLTCTGTQTVALDYRLSQLDADHLRLNVCTQGNCTNSQLTRCR